MTTTSARGSAIHPRIVRLTHWINAAAMLVLIASGWQIYNAFPILPFAFPKAVALGGWLGGALLWHFAAMWLLMANFLIVLVYGLASGRFRSKLWPISLKALAIDLRAALMGRLVHDDLGRYNSVQKLLYTGVLSATLVAILSGFAIWKPVQLQTLTSLMGGFQGARLVHFLAMAAVTAFLIIHVVMALLVPRSLRAMVRGR